MAKRKTDETTKHSAVELDEGALEKAQGGGVAYQDFHFTKTLDKASLSATSRGVKLPGALDKSVKISGDGSV